MVGKLRPVRKSTEAEVWASVSSLPFLKKENCETIFFKPLTYFSNNSKNLISVE